MNSQGDPWSNWLFGHISGPAEEGQSFPPLREFVYIDQRSVQSLLASTNSGRVAAEQRDREGNITKSRKNANLSLNAGPASASAGGRSTSQESHETESTYTFDLVQSKFTRLYEHEEVSQKISLNSEGEYELKDPLELTDLERGDVLEFRGVVQLHSLYRLHQVIEYAETTVPDEEIAGDDTMQMIEKSLGDKIPIRIEVDGLSLSSDDDVLQGTNSEILNVVALLDKPALWTEPIQTLASKKQFRVFCRVEQVEPDWYPMKLIRVLQSISQNKAKEFNSNLESRLDAAMASFEESTNVSDPTLNVDRDEVEEFVEFLSTKTSSKVNEDDIEEVVEKAIEAYSLEGEVKFEQQNALLKEIYNQFIKVVSKDGFSKDEFSLRTEYRKDEGSGLNEGSDGNSDTHLEVNVIGIYW